MKKKRWRLWLGVVLGLLLLYIISVMLFHLPLPQWVYPREMAIDPEIKTIQKIYALLKNEIEKRRPGTDYVLYEIGGTAYTEDTRGIMNWRFRENKEGSIRQFFCVVDTTQSMVLHMNFYNDPERDQFETGNYLKVEDWTLDIEEMKKIAYEYFGREPDRVITLMNFRVPIGRTSIFRDKHDNEFYVIISGEFFEENCWVDAVTGTVREMSEEDIEARRTRHSSFWN